MKGPVAMTHAERSRAYYLRNRDAVLERLKLRRIADPEGARARDRMARERDREERNTRRRERHQKNPDKARASDAKYRNENKGRLADLRQARHAADPEKGREACRKWWKTNGHKLAEKKRAATKAWAKANPERVRATRRAWQLAHPAEYRARLDASLAKRRARERGARVGCRRAYRAYMRWARNVPAADCNWCHQSTTPKSRHIDHIIPLSRGGADAVENLCIACPPCNRKKGAKMPEDFAGQSELRFA